MLEADRSLGEFADILTTENGFPLNVIEVRRYPYTVDSEGKIITGPIVENGWVDEFESQKELTLTEYEKLHSDGFDIPNFSDAELHELFDRERKSVKFEVKPGVKPDTSMGKVITHHGWELYMGTAIDYIRKGRLVNDGVAKLLTRHAIRDNSSDEILEKYQHYNQFRNLPDEVLSNVRLLAGTLKPKEEHDYDVKKFIRDITSPALLEIPRSGNREEYEERRTFVRKINEIHQGNSSDPRVLWYRAAMANKVEEAVSIIFNVLKRPALLEDDLFKQEVELWQHHWVLPYKDNKKVLFYYDKEKAA